MSQATGFQYWLSSDATSWATANQICMDLEAHLASVHSQEENDLIFGFDESVTAVRWLGGVLVRTSTPQVAPFVHEWTDGTPFDFNNFLAGDPNDLNGKEDCVAMGHADGDAGEWNDMRCAVKRKYVCKKVIQGRQAYGC